MIDQPGHNALCPCESGKKYLDCCFPRHLEISRMDRLEAGSSGRPLRIVIMHRPAPMMFFGRGSFLSMKKGYPGKKKEGISPFSRCVNAGDEDSGG